jgi:hypothetical protein
MAIFVCLFVWGDQIHDAWAGKDVGKGTQNFGWK